MPKTTAMSHKLVSLVTSSLNRAQYIEDCIRSVRAQDYPYIEHIIIDGGSTDGTVDVIRRYEAGLAYWVSEKDAGAADAINKGWRRARGEFLWLLNSDDLLVVPQAISALVRYLEENPDVGFVYGDRVDIGETGEVIRTKRFSDYDLLRVMMLKGGLFLSPGCLMRKQVLMEVGYLNQNFRFSNDLDFLIRMARRYRLGHLPQPTGCFRFHSTQLSAANPYPAAKEIIAIYEETLRASDLPHEVRRHESKLRGIAYRVAGVGCFKSGHSQEARGYLLQAIYLYPALLFHARVVVQLLLTFLGDRGMVRARAAVRSLLRMRGN